MTAAAMFSDADRDRAELLITEIRAGFANIERKTIELIEMRGWVALGYRTFEQMWNDRLRGIGIATNAMKAHVVYALLDTADRETIEEATGVSAGIIEHLQEQKLAGLPPGKASAREKPTSVRQHGRELPGPAQTVHVKITRGEYRAWSRLAKPGSTVGDLGAV